MTDRQRNQPIADGKIEGNQITFVLVGDVYGQDRGQTYTGTITEDGLKIVPPRMGGAGGAPGGFSRGQVELPSPNSSLHARRPKFANMPPIMTVGRA